MICTGVPVDQIDAVWPWVEPLLAPAIDVAERNEGEREDVYAEIAAGRKQLYVAVDGEDDRMALVTSVELRGDGKVVYLAYLGGKGLSKFMRLQPRFVEWAKSLGCVAMESSSPKAMLRFMKGWKEVGPDGDLHRLRLDI